MTKQEAEAFAARLERVWKPVSGFAVVKEEAENVGPEWSFLGLLNPECDFVGSVNEGESVPFLLLNYAPEGAPRPIPLVCTDCDYDKPNGKIYVFDRADMAAQWMDFFRRGCWLSGCDIEATTHEKMEWMQGFSREEIESWNLKM